MKDALQLRGCFPSLEKKLLDEIETHGRVKYFESQEYVVTQGEVIRFLPMVLEGHVKVVSNEDATSFLLYYVSFGETCIYSFAHLFGDTPSEFSAITESSSKLLLLPINKVQTWLQTYPSLGQLIINSYQKHYTDLLNTTKQIVCYNLEERLVDYLQTKAQLENNELLAISHKEIAYDLGTSREVISRLMKKLSKDKQITQIGRKIKIAIK